MIYQNCFPSKEWEFSHLKILEGGKLCVEFKKEGEEGPSDKEEKLGDIKSNSTINIASARSVSQPDEPKLSFDKPNIL